MDLDQKRQLCKDLKWMYRAFAIFFLFSLSLRSLSQNCTIDILQKDTSICPGSLVKLNSALVTNNSSCNTYGLSPALQANLLGWFPFCGNTNDIGPQQNNAMA